MEIAKNILAMAVLCFILYRHSRYGFKIYGPFEPDLRPPRKRKMTPRQFLYKQRWHR
ncbi:hypothetical protein SAMN06265348_11710 [Pedobacter westerhofensis]|uniref:Uncharacterized protein n=1 Tax=Pedobacter westerhofensis TaxID=425512 RepID=A0A521FQR2_9SPHI|nr:hypothetical protein [Pedobacter westerhofensis]SMO98555.1 hypothetical protein SAMN06265348_11710 [Pedobacter westerhofensis]